MSINGIADQRVADMRHVHADLMGSPRFECAGDKRGLIELPLGTIMGDRMFALSIGENGHFLAIGRGPSDLGSHRSCGWNRMAMHYGPILPVDVMCRE